MEKNWEKSTKIFGNKQVFGGGHVYPIGDFFGILHMVTMDHFEDILKITTFFFPIHHHGYEELTRIN
jgi:hypothetical protein